MNPLRNFHLIQPFFKIHWPLFVTGIVILIFVDLLQLAIPRLIGYAVDSLIADKKDIYQYLGLLIGVSFLIALLRYLYREFIMGTTRRLESWLRELIFSHALRIDLPFYDEHGPGKIMAYTTNDIAAIRVAVGFGTMLFIDAVIMGLASLVVMAEMIDWRLTVWSILPLPFILAGATRMGRSVHERFRNVQDKFSYLTEFAQEIMAGAKIIKGFSSEQNTIERFSVANQENVNANMKLAWLQAAYMPVTHIAPLLCYAIALYVGGSMIIDGTITVGDFAAFTGYLGLIIWPVMGLGYLINTLQRGTASLERIKQFLDQPLYEQGDNSDDEMLVCAPAIMINNLTFRYPKASEPALQRFSCTIPPGSIVGIVGGTGSGKSTLLKLLLRLYDPPQDAIYLNDHEIHEINIHNLRHSIGYVPQDSFLFSRSIGENISFSSDWPRSDIEEAARLSAVHEAIDEKPQGFSTVLGEKGKKLSGGQQQRIAIARAMVKKPHLLMFDDIFSSLDYRTQSELLGNMREFVKGRTVLIVSQRIAAVRDVDYILVMNRGSVAEEGTHQELVAKGGLYYSLYEQQLVNGEE